MLFNALLRARAYYQGTSEVERGEGPAGAERLPEGLLPAPEEGAPNPLPDDAHTQALHDGQAMPFNIDFLTRFSPDGIISEAHIQTLRRDISCVQGAQPHEIVDYLVAQAKWLTKSGYQYSAGAITVLIEWLSLYQHMNLELLNRLVDGLAGEVILANAQFIVDAMDRSVTNEACEGVPEEKQAEEGGDNDKLKAIAKKLYAHFAGPWTLEAIRYWGSQGIDAAAELSGYVESALDQLTITDEQSRKNILVYVLKKSGKIPGGATAELAPQLLANILIQGAQDDSSSQTDTFTDIPSLEAAVIDKLAKILWYESVGINDIVKMVGLVKRFPPVEEDFLEGGHAQALLPQEAGGRRAALEFNTTLIGCLLKRVLPEFGGIKKNVANNNMFQYLVLRSYISGGELAALKQMYKSLLDTGNQFLRQINMLCSRLVLTLHGEMMRQYDDSKYCSITGEGDCSTGQVNMQELSPEKIDAFKTQVIELMRYALCLPSEDVDRQRILLECLYLLDHLHNSPNTPFNPLELQGNAVFNEFFAPLIEAVKMPVEVSSDAQQNEPVEQSGCPNPSASYVDQAIARIERAMACWQSQALYYRSGQEDYRLSSVMKLRNFEAHILDPIKSIAGEGDDFERNSNLLKEAYYAGMGAERPSKAAAEASRGATASTDAGANAVANNNSEQPPQILNTEDYFPAGRHNAYAF